VLSLAFVCSGAGSRASAQLARSSASGCGNDYAYAGAQNAAKKAGIRAKLSMLKSPKVPEGGHVAGWVGVGGPGLGPNGKDEWLQIGYSFFAGQSQIYYEVTLPGKAPTYHPVKSKVAANEKHRVTVLEVGDKHGSWRVWLDDKAVSPVYSLPQSHKKFAPQAIGETWNPGTKGCNSYAYQFADIQAASAPGGGWSTAKAGYQWRDSHNQLVKVSNDTFKARSTTSASSTAADEPPLLGAIASRLAATPLDARCVPGGALARAEQDALVLNEKVCQILLGYAVAQPWSPQAGAAPELEIGVVGLAFVRAVARAAGLGADDVDCGALKRFYGAFRSLGARSADALRLRDRVLRSRSIVRPRLVLARDCPIR